MRKKESPMIDRNEKTTEKLNDLISLLEECSCYLKQYQNKTNPSYKSLQSFKQFEKNLTQFRSSNKRTLLKTLLSNWDLIILALLSIIFAAYLAYFISSYFANTNYLDLKSQFYADFWLLYKWLVSKWLHFNNFQDLRKEECALVKSDTLNWVLRPVENCEMCNGLAEIKRVRNVTKEEFLRDYAYTGVPVVITEAIKNWSALKVLNFDFLRDLYLNNVRGSSSSKTGFRSSHSSKNSKDDELLTCQFFPYKTRFKSLVEVLEMGPDRMKSTPWYVGWSNCNNQASKVLRKHYKRPYFLPDEAEMSGLDWIFMGTPGYGALMHIDDVDNPSWQAQISGVKRWTFMPPAECLFKCPFVLYADVHPGDIIVFDSNRWFHSTFIVGPDLSLTIGSEYD